MHKCSLALNIALLSVALAGCGTAQSDSSDRPDKSDEAGAPQSGSYVFRDQLVVDGCGMFSGELSAPDPIEVKVSPDGQHFEWDEDGVTVECDKAPDGVFECQSPSIQLPMGEVIMDASWNDRGGFDGAINIFMDCEDDPADPDRCAIFEAASGVELPCESEILYVADRAVPDGFEASEGDYQITVGNPLVTTCADPLSDGTEILTGTFDGTTLSVGDTRVACDVDARGIYSCEVDVPFGDAMTVAISAQGAFTDVANSGGSLLATLQCSDGGTDCDEFGLFGELPCSTTFAVRSELLAGIAQ